MSFPHFLLHVLMKLDIKQNRGHIIHALLLRAAFSLGEVYSGSVSTTVNGSTHFSSEWVVHNLLEHSDILDM